MENLTNQILLSAYYRIITVGDADKYDMEMIK